MNYRIRHATPDDAPFIVWGMAAALEMEITDSMLQEGFEALVKREDVLYSWKNACVAVSEEGEPIGLLIAYDGAGYRQMRKATSAFISQFVESAFETMDEETKAGEYYLDSLAVIPEYRQQGIGRNLLAHGIETARREGFREAVLAVDPENINAQRLYRSLGFKDAGEMFIFGHTFWRWSIVNE